jgi:hypothetical protein
MFDPRIHDYNLIQAMGTMRQRGLSEAVKSERLARRSDQMSPVCRFLVRVGDLLIVVGRGLRARYAPTAQPAPEICCAEC